MEFIKIKNFCFFNSTFKTHKNQDIIEDKRTSIHIFDKGLMHRRFIKILKINLKRNLIKRQIILVGTLHKGCLISIKHMIRCTTSLVMTKISRFDKVTHWQKCGAMITFIHC